MDRGDIVRALFEYSDLTGGKRRPACIVSVEAFNRTGEVVIAMITSSGGRLAAPGIGDVVLEDWQAEGCVLHFSERDVFWLGRRMSCPSREAG